MHHIFRSNKIEDIKKYTPFSKLLKCKISSKNVIAYCYYDSAHPTHDISLRFDVFVCDLLSPWNTYKVCSIESCIQVLEWNYSGEWLVVAEKGCIKLWKCKNQELNSWTCSYAVTLQNEIIVDCKFFFYGKRIVFNTIKRDCPFYAEKYERVKFKPSFLKFGKVSAEGCVVLTSSGLFGVFSIPLISQVIANPILKTEPINVEIQVETLSLGLVRNFVELSTISCCGDGSFRIATCCSQDTLINCFKISLKYQNQGKLLIVRESLPGVFLKGISDVFELNYKITHMKWIVMGEEDQLFVSYNIKNSSIIEQWNLRTNNKSIHKFLQKSKIEFLQFQSWENVARHQLPSQLNDLCYTRNKFDKQFLYLLLNDNTIYMIETGLEKVSILPQVKYQEESLKWLPFIAFDISIMSQVFILLNSNGDIYALQASNRYTDLKPNEVLALQVSLFEYCIISGLDGIDIILLHIISAESLIEKLTENFMRQPSFIRQYYYSNFLTLKSNICRMQSKQNDFDNLIELNSISIAFKSLLRPSDLACHDKGPAESLSIVLSDALPDVDKVLFNLDAKDFTVEPLTLQSLQQLIQWVADLTLNILCKLSEDPNKNKCKKIYYELSKDSAALNNIRELLAIIRIWGLLNSQCLPIYTKSMENIDVLSVIFRLLTRHLQNPTEPDEILLDECMILSTQVLIPNCNFFKPVSLLNVHLMNSNLIQLVSTKAFEPHVQYNDLALERVMYLNNTKDGVSNLFLGKTQKQLKECIRCGLVSDSSYVAKSSAMRAWCQRWINCRCGGYWKST